MKKQFFLYLVIGLSLFNITSFSMQSEDEALIKRKPKPYIPKSLRGLSEEEIKECYRKSAEALEKSRNVLNATTIRSASRELVPIVDEKMKRVGIDFVYSTVLGSVSEDKSHIAKENIAFLESIQRYSLESLYKEGSFVLFHGPYGTGKTTIASKFGQLLNKKTKIFNFDMVGAKNGWILQKVITECIEKNITEDGEPCVFFLDEVDRLLSPHDFNHSNRDELSQNLINCLSEVRRINQKQKQQKYFIIAATNHTERIEEILPFFKCIEINNPNFEQRVKILGELIDSKHYSFDISTLDQNTIENIAKKFEGISIFELNQLIDHSTEKAQNEYYESNQDFNLTKLPLCERHFITFEGEFALQKQNETTFFSRLKELGSESSGTPLCTLEVRIEGEDGRGIFSDDHSDEEFELIVNEEKPRELSCLNFEQRVEVLKNLIQKMKNDDDIFDANEWDQDLIEEVAKTLEGYSVDSLKDLFEQAVRIAQEEIDPDHDEKHGPIPFHKRYIEQAKKLIFEEKISDQKTEESSSQKDWLRKKADDIVNAIPDFFSKISGLFPTSLFSRGKNLIEKISSCTRYKVSSIVMIIFHFLLRKPF